MSTSAIEAIFKDGVFRPLARVAIPDGQQVRLVVEVDEPMHPVLKLAMSVYDGLSEEEIDEIERIVLNRCRCVSEPKME